MIVVVGSINMDLVIELDRLPELGATVSAGRLSRYSGGKGANQAAAAARLGARVRFFGAVGDDADGERLLRDLRDQRVDASAVEIVESVPSGLANVWVDANGGNAIAVVSGANARVDRNYVDRHLDRIAASDVLLLQLEIPLDTVDYLLRRLPADRPQVILDPAPACNIGSLSLSRVDLLTPNAQELLAIGGAADAESSARNLLERGARDVICTVGEDGAVWYAADRPARRFAAPRADVVDTTAAGDAFNGALAWALERGDIEDAIPWAVAAGALATTVRGAQPSLPTLDDLRRFHGST